MSELIESIQPLAERRAITDAEIFEAHVGGKLSVGPTAPLDTQRALSIGYTPGVAQVSRAIAADPSQAARYTWANRLVAVVSDGSAVRGLGDIGPAASLPVMEGKCALFQSYGGLNAIPIVLDTTEAIFSVVSDDLAFDRIVPSPLDLRVGHAVATAVALAADPADIAG